MDEQFVLTNFDLNKERQLKAIQEHSPDVAKIRDACRQLLQKLLNSGLVVFVIGWEQNGLPEKISLLKKFANPYQIEHVTDSLFEKIAKELDLEEWFTRREIVHFEYRADR